MSVTPVGLTGTGRGAGHIANFVSADCSQMWLDGGDHVEVFDMSNPAAPRSLGKFESVASQSANFRVSHDTERDSKGVLWSVGGGGAAGYQLTADPLAPKLVSSTGPAGVNPSPYNDFILHNSKRNGNTLLITEEDYLDTDEVPPGGCRGQGKFETWSIAMRPGGLTPLDTWMTEMNGSDSKASATVNCSSHWFEVSKDLVAVGWYEQGTRFLDVHDPRNIRQVGFYLPANGSTWGAFWSPTDPTRSIVYTADAYLGVDVLRIDRKADLSTMPTSVAPIPTSWFTTPAAYAPLRHVAVRVPVDRRRRRLTFGHRRSPFSRIPISSVHALRADRRGVHRRPVSRLRGAPAGGAGRLRRGDRPLADLPVPGRRRPPARSQVRSDVPPYGDPRGDGPADAAGVALRRSGTSSTPGSSTWSRPTTRASASWCRRPSRRSSSKRFALACRRSSTGCVDGVADTGEFDMLPTLAEPLPVIVIAEMLGVPEADHHLLRPWSADIVKMYELTPAVPAQRDAVRASVEFSEYLRGLARERRSDPGEDLISALVHVVDEGEHLTEDELVGTCVLLLNAGHEATVNSTLLGWWALFRHPDRLKELRADPSLIPTAIEELLRYQTPLPMFERWVLEPFELHGVAIPKGAELGLLFDSANRDPDVFEDPDELRLDRRPNPHLTFGAGIHFCLGAPLGRMELQISFRTLLERFPDMELVEEPNYRPNFIIRGLEGLVVTTGGSRGRGNEGGQ